MRYRICHLYGPLSIHAYGLCIALGLAVFVLAIRKHRLFKKLNLEPIFSHIFIVGIVAGLIGGRLLHLLTETDDIFDIKQWFVFWEAGFSVLGTIIAVLIAIPWYLRKKGVPVLPFLDLIAIYAPLLQSISRIGCFFAGCCHGIATVKPWAIVYSDPESIAPLGVYLHPTQLYSSLLLFLIFVLMYGILQHRFKISGQLLAWYLILESSERFFTDIWRANRIIIAGIFSVEQVIASLLFASGILGLWYLSSRTKKVYN